MSARPRVAVVGHVEWLTHALGSFPGPGEITRLAEPLREPAGGGAVAAAQAAKLGAETLFFTALGGDEAGERTRTELAAIGVEVLAVRREAPQTRAVATVDASGDRAIAVIGPPTDPRADDPLPWERLADCDAAYFTGHDPQTLQRARGARRLVVTARRRSALEASGVRADVVVASADDPAEDPSGLPVPPGAVVLTEGARGGRYRAGDEPERRWEPVPPPGPPLDTYGSGDSFAAGLTVGLGRGWPLAEAIALGARCGATNLTGRGGLRAQLREGGPTA